MEQNDLRALLSEGGTQLGLSFTSLQMDQLMTYLQELVRWNKKINLTGVKEEREMVIKLFLDSLTPLCFLEPDQENKWIDVGSGAGFPGLVLKIASPGLNMTLLESNQKKVSFLHHLIGLLGLPSVVVLNERLEQLSLSGVQRKYDLLLTRALSTQLVLEKGAPIVTEGGKILFFKARSNREEWENILSYYPLLVLDQIKPVQLPFSPAIRSLIFIDVSGNGKRFYAK